MSSNRSCSLVAFLLHSTFALSGMASLVHELSWSRQLGVVIGQTTDAATVVLVAYFGGLALGALLAPRVLERIAGLRLYAMVEILAGAWAIAFPQLVIFITDPSPHELFLLMLPATVCIGAALPAIASELEARPSGTGSSSFAYALNTLGGLAGVALSVSGLFVELGVSASSQAMGGLQVLCGVVLLGITPASRASRVDEPVPLAPLAIERRFLMLAFLSGFVTLALELLHLRLYSFIFHNSTFSFALVLGAVIFGLAVASFLVSSLGERVEVSRLLRLGVIFVPLTASALLTGFVLQTDLRKFEAGHDFTGYMLGAALCVTVFTAPLFLLAGLVLPATWTLATSGGAFRGRSVGYLGGASSLGAAIGAWILNFHLLPGVGVVASFAVVIVTTGLSMLAARVTVGQIVMILGVSLALCSWTAEHLGARLPDRSLEVVSRWESAYGWIDLTRCRDRNGFMEIRQNVHYVLGNTAASRAEERQGHLPLLMHPRPRDVLFIGLGTGLTAISAVRHPLVEKATVVELIPDVIRAARQLGEFIQPLFEDPRVRILAEDGRHHLRQGQRYDVIASDLFVPWESRTGYLYTREFYQQTRSSLAPGGLFCQWLPVYQLGEKELEVILDTFASVFPVTTVWWCQIDERYPILGMVGTEGPLRIDGEIVEERLRGIETRDPWLVNAARVLDLFAGSWPRREQGAMNTDEHPVLEFGAPIAERDGRLLIGERLRDWFERELSSLSPVGVLARSAPGQSLSARGERVEMVRWRLASRNDP